MEKTASAQKDVGPPLTPRECDVLRLLVSRASDKQIAAALGISPRTASHHVASIIHKLGAETRAGARRWASGNGIGANGPLPGASTTDSASRAPPE